MKTWLVEYYDDDKNIHVTEFKSRNFLNAVEIATTNYGSWIKKLMEIGKEN